MIEINYFVFRYNNIFIYYLLIFLLIMMNSIYLNIFDDLFLYNNFFFYNYFSYNLLLDFFNNLPFNEYWNLHNLFHPFLSRLSTISLLKLLFDLFLFLKLHIPKTFAIGTKFKIAFFGI